MLGQNCFEIASLFKDSLLHKSVEMQLRHVLDELQKRYYEQIELNSQLLSNQVLKQTTVKIETQENFDPIIKKQEPIEQEQEINEVEIKNTRAPSQRRSKNLNETKNVPKNFGKAIIKFSEKKENLVRKCLAEQESRYREFITLLKIKKKSINSIAQLRGLWLQDQFEFASAMRKISFIFLTKYSLKHIFGSRITNYSAHIKYRARMIQVLANPTDFTYIKSC